MSKVSLKEYIERLVDGLQAQIDRRFEANDKLQNERTVGLNHRLEGMNEFREQLTTQASTFVRLDAFERLRTDVGGVQNEQASRSELIVEHKQMRADISTLKSTSASRDAVDSYKKWLYALGAVVILEGIPVAINSYHTLTGK